MSLLDFIIIAVLISITGLVGIFVFLLIYQKRKIKILFFDTDKTAQILSLQNKEAIKLINKKFILKNAKPTMLKTSLGWFPFHIIKHDIPTPLALPGKDDKHMKNIFQPAMVNSMITCESLKTLLTITRKGTKTEYASMIIGGVIGFLAGVVLAMTGIIPSPDKK